jgi:hypothetical protein
MDNLNATISMRQVQYEDGSCAVELTVLGLTSKQDTEAVIRLMERIFCAEEIVKQ